MRGVEPQFKPQTLEIKIHILLLISIRPSGPSQVQSEGRFALALR